MLSEYYKTLKRFKTRYVKDKRGTVVIEFSAVIFPLLLLLFGSIAISLYFFTTFSLEFAIKDVARGVRTGQLQNAGYTKEMLINDVCNQAVVLIDCENNIRLGIFEFTDFENIELPSCTNTNGELIENLSDNNEIPGVSGSIVFILACYEWTLTGMIPFINLGQMSNGSSLIQTATIFRTEPF